MTGDNKLRLKPQGCFWRYLKNVSDIWCNHVLVGNPSGSKHLQLKQGN